MGLSTASGITATIIVENTNTGDVYTDPNATIYVRFDDVLRVNFKVCDNGHIYNKYKNAGYRDDQIPSSVPYRTFWEYVAGSVIVSEGYGPSGYLQQYNCVTGHVLITISQYKNYQPSKIYFEFDLQYPPGSTWNGVVVYTGQLALMTTPRFKIDDR